MKYRLIIFDFDGTLADSFPWLLSILNDLADRHQLKRLDESQIPTLRGMDPSHLIRQSGLPMWKILQVGNSMKKMMAEQIHKISLFEGVDGALAGLKQAGATLAVVSSNSCENVRRVLGPENAALISHFECGVAVMGKAEKFRKVLRKSRIGREDAIAIGDEIRDIEAARKAQIACGSVAWGYARFDALAARSPDEVFLSVAELLPRLTA